MAEEGGARTVWFDGAEVPAAVHRRSSLRAGARFSGPAVLEEGESTLVIPYGGEAEVLMDGEEIHAGDCAGMNAPFKRSRAGTAVAATDAAVDEAAVALVRAGLLDSGARELRLLLRPDRRWRSVAGAGDREHPELHRHAAEDGEALPALLPPDELAPGDVLITNDIWLGTGHLQDITVAKPIFGGRLVGVQRLHGARAGYRGKIRSPEPREVFEEGLQIPPWKLIRAGKSMRRWWRSSGRRADAGPDEGRSVGPDRGVDLMEDRSGADGRYGAAGPRGSRPKSMAAASRRCGRRSRPCKRDLPQRVANGRADGPAHYAADGADVAW